MTACLLLFVAVEIMMRAGIITPSFEYFDMDFNIVLDDKVLYRIKPHSSMEINNKGYRDDNFDKARDNRKRIVFLGDSFVMGMTSSSRQTIPNQLESLLGDGYEVMNMGVYGYGPDQSLVQLTGEAFDYDPDMVILALFPTNDFSDIAKNRIFEFDNGVLVKNPDNLVKSALPSLQAMYLFDYLRYKVLGEGLYFTDLFIELFRDLPDFDLYYDSERSTRIKELFRGVLREFKTQCHERSIPFFVIILPYGPVTEERFFPEGMRFFYETMAERILREEGIAYLNLVPVLLQNGYWNTLYKMDDSGEHFSAYGHEFIAEAIRQYLISNAGTNQKL